MHIMQPFFDPVIYKNRKIFSTLQMMPLFAIAHMARNAERAFLVYCEMDQNHIFN